MIRNSTFGAALISAGLVASSAAANIITMDELSVHQQNTLIRAAQTFAEYPDLVKVAYCESSLAHLNPDGSVKRGEVNSQDIGLMQINLSYHAQDSRKLGYDVFIEAQNKAYALHLVRTQGLQPWKASEDCWRNLQLPDVTLLAGAA